MFTHKIAATLLIALCTSLGCISAPQLQELTPSPPGTLAESSVACFGFTGRLMLMSGGDDVEPPNPQVLAPPLGGDWIVVPGVSWGLDVEGPPGMVSADSITGWVDSYVIEQSQGSQRGVVRANLSGKGPRLSARGQVRLADRLGVAQDSARVRITAAIQTPAGSFMLRGIAFDLGRHGDALAAIEPLPVPFEVCPEPEQSRNV